MNTKLRQRREEHGHRELGTSRYAALYIAQAGWLVVGFWLMTRAFWPSTCTPDGLLDLYRCSLRLPEQRGWVEAALLTWLWATPILAGMELSRRVRLLLDR